MSTSARCQNQVLVTCTSTTDETAHETSLPVGWSDPCVRQQRIGFTQAQACDSDRILQQPALGRQALTTCGGCSPASSSSSPEDSATFPPVSEHLLHLLLQACHLDILAKPGATDQNWRFLTMTLKTCLSEQDINPIRGLAGMR